ncbi:MAG: Ig-like domain-containing protein [Marmoricola sp.]
MRRRRLLASVIALCLGGIAFIGAQVSGATYSGVSSYNSSVTAANDWTPPTVAVTTPAASTLFGSATVSASASDARGVVASVVLQYAAAGSQSFTTLCTSAASPYSCTWNTTQVVDGSYQLRAIATDDSGNSATSAVVSVTVTNTVSVILTDPGDNLRGSVPLTAKLQAAPGVTATMRIEYALANSTTYTAIPGCGNLTSTTTRSCIWVTSGSQNYDLRAVAIANGTTAYDVVIDVTIDNVAPTVTLSVPTGPLRGTVTLSATAADDLSGVDNVQFQYRQSLTTPWLSCGTATAAPYTCNLNTAGLLVGSYEFRAIATDLAGNTATSATQTRTVDNSAGTVSISSPSAGSTVAGTFTVTADANFALGVASVRIEARPVGGTFAAVCTDTTAPYSCSWPTGASGSYELRAVMTQTGGGTVFSAIVAVTVDNNVLKAQDVQGFNGGTNGKADAGDRLVLTYSTLVDLTSIKSGWNGTSTSVTVDLKDAKVAGATNAGFDRFELGSGLGQVSTTANLVTGSGSTGFTGSTMTASTVNISGTNVTVITVTLGNAANTTVIRSSTATATLKWYPTAAVRSLAGTISSTTPISELGSADSDF